MANKVGVVTVSVSEESRTYNEELSDAINTAVSGLGSPFDTAFDVVSIEKLPGGGRTTISGTYDEAKTIKTERYRVIVQG